MIILAKLLLSETPVSSSSINDVLNVSRKTIADAIQRLDCYLPNYGAAIQTVNGIGYSIDVKDEEKFGLFRDIYLRHYHRSRYMNLDYYYLAYLIILELLVAEGYSMLEELSDKYFYSISTISQNLKKAKEMLMRFNLRIMSRPNYGIILSGTEWDKRICMLYFLRVANEINFIELETVPIIPVFRNMLEKDLDNYFLIKSRLEPILHEYRISMPLVYQMLVTYYVYLSQTRAAWYDQMEFSRDQKDRIEDTGLMTAAGDIASAFREIGYSLRKNDITAIAILIDCFMTRGEVGKLSREQYEIGSEDTGLFISRLTELYPGFETVLDEPFFNEFVCYLSGLRERVFFCMPSDTESIYEAKLAGAFLGNLCIDFGRFYHERYGIILETEELLRAYHIFAGASVRNGAFKSQFRAIMVSLNGLSFARDVATRLLHIYGNVIRKIEPMELNDANYADLSDFDFIITDIAPNQFLRHDLPLLNFDIYRNNNLRSLDRFIAHFTESSLRSILVDENIIRDKSFHDKDDVFQFLAMKYVIAEDRANFLEDCRFNNQLLSCERKNRIALISTIQRYYNRQEIILIISRTPFFWDNGQVQMIFFFNYRGIGYQKSRIYTTLQTRLMGDSAGIAQAAGQMSAEEIITLISNSQFKD